MPVPREGALPAEEIKRFAKIIALAVAVVVTPSVSSADMRQFIPRVLEYSGELEVMMRYEDNENSTRNNTVSSKDAFFTERLNLTLDGYVYHPRLLLFHVGLSPGLKEETFSSSTFGKSPLTVGVAMDYDLKAQILAEHPYHLDLYASRRTFFTRGILSQNGQPVSYDKGAIFYYKKRPFFASLGYRTTTVTTGNESSDSTDYSGSLSHFSGPFQTDAVYSHTDSSTTLGQKTVRTDYLFQNQVRPKWITVISSVESISLGQSDPFSGQQDSKSLYWAERAEASLPWHFDVDASYGYTKETLSGPDVTELATSTRTDDVSFNLTHKLYASLITRYGFRSLRSHSTTGDLTLTSNTLGADYTKKIPWGVLRTGVMVRQYNSGNTGAPGVVNEPQGAALFGEFTLRSQNIDVNTVVVRVSAPVTGFLELLQKDIHYTLAAVGTSVRVRIISLPPDVQSTDPLFVYSFSVSYSIISDNVQFRTSEFSYNLSLSLFNDLLNPYFNYTSITQDITSGTIPGGAESSKSYTGGLRIDRRPFTVLGEYEINQSRLNPTHGWRSEISYNQNLAPTFNVFAKAYYTRTIHGQSEISTDIAGFEETLMGLDLRFQKSFPYRNIFTSGGASISRNTQDQVKTLLYSLNALLTWKVGLFELSLGGNVSHSSAALPTGDQKYFTEYYYLNMKRKLF